MHDRAQGAAELVAISIIGAGSLLTLLGPAFAAVIAMSLATGGDLIIGFLLAFLVLVTGVALVKKGIRRWLRLRNPVGELRGEQGRAW